MSSGVTRARHLAFEAIGSTSACPVFLMHGMPGSRQVPRPRRYLLDILNIRLITFDRPGYGGRPACNGRQVADAAADVAEIADALGIDEFAVVGRSGGGPHALAAAALLPDRVTRAASLGGLAPPDAEGLDWLAGMCETNKTSFRLVVPPDNAAVLRERDVDFLTEQPGMPLADRTVLADAGIRDALARMFSGASTPEARETPAGWEGDLWALTHDWGFDPCEIKVPVMLWHGEQDVHSPITHARWLADRIPEAVLIADRRKAHLGTLSVLPDVMQWLVS